MKLKSIYIWLLTIICIFLLIILYFFISSSTKESFVTIQNQFDSYGTKPTSKIPNIIWTFWEGEPPELIQKCIKSWKYYNPTYEIRIVNKQNYSQYTDRNVNSIKHSNDSLARYSDYIRLAILSKHGGIWIDASIICHMSLDWLHGIQQATKCEMIGYYLDKFTKLELLNKSPVIESWFFACIPNSKFMVDWCNEFYRTVQFQSIDDYIKNLQKIDGIDLQKIAYLNYLAIHCAAQKVLQQTSKESYDLVLFSAVKGPYKYLEDGNWDPKTAMDRLTNDSTRTIYFNLPIIKLRSRERDVIDNYNISRMFSNE